MRSSGILTTLVLVLCAGCSCGPNYYGPGLNRNPYGSCIDSNRLAPPIAMGCKPGHHKQTLVERKQARELRRWYRELNDTPAQGHRDSGACPHCQRKLRRQSNNFEPAYYDDFAYHEGEIVDDYYDGQIIGGGFDGECQTCQQNYAGEMYSGEIYDGGIYGPGQVMEQPYESPPAYSDPGLIPSAPPAEPSPTPTTAPVPPAEASINEYYSPNVPQPQSTQPVLVSPVRQVSIPPVEQMLYAPPIQK